MQTNVKVKIRVHNLQLGPHVFKRNDVTVMGLQDVEKLGTSVTILPEEPEKGAGKINLKSSRKNKKGNDMHPIVSTGTSKSNQDQGTVNSIEPGSSEAAVEKEIHEENIEVKETKNARPSSTKNESMNKDTNVKKSSRKTLSKNNSKNGMVKDDMGT